MYTTCSILSFRKLTIERINVECISKWNQYGNLFWWRRRKRSGSNWRHVIWDGKRENRQFISFLTMWTANKHINGSGRTYRFLFKWFTVITIIKVTPTHNFNAIATRVKLHFLKMKIWFVMCPFAIRLLLFSQHKQLY